VTDELPHLLHITPKIFFAILPIRALLPGFERRVRARASSLQQRDKIIGSGNINEHTKE
jgi:hypothetical protein